MARCALRLKHPLARPRVADDDALRFFAGAVVTAHPEAVNELGDVGDLRGAQIDRDHRGAGAAVLHDGADQLTALIAEHELRAKQVRSTVVPASGILAVTERAI